MIRYPIISPISLSSLQISHIKSYCSQKDKDSSVQIYLLRGTYNAKQYNALVHNPLSQKWIYFFVFRISMHEVNIFIRLVSSVHSMQWEGDSMNGLLILTRNIGHIESSQREREQPQLLMEYLCLYKPWACRNYIVILSGTNVLSLGQWGRGVNWKWPQSRKSRKVLGQPRS